MFTQVITEITICFYSRRIKKCCKGYSDGELIPNEKDSVSNLTSFTKCKVIVQVFLESEKVDLYESNGKNCIKLVVKVF